MKKHQRKFKKQFVKLFPNFEYKGKTKTPHGKAMAFKSSNFCVCVALPVEFRGKTITPELWGRVHTTMYQAKTMGHSELLIWFDVI